MRTAMFNPGATYRMQFHKGFTFKQLQQVIPYLQRLGVGTLYASPVFQAVEGSTHGYDGVDALRINPEIGTPEQLTDVSGRLRKGGAGWLQDIVPNHMAYHPANKWLMDVLEKGPLSRYKNYFDQGFATTFYKLPLMAPFLGAPLLEVIQNGELTVGYDAGRLFFRYYDHRWPLKIASYPAFFPELKKQIDQVLELKDPDAFCRAVDAFRQTLPQDADEVGRLREINADKPRLQQLADGQYYRLCCWEETRHHINYRRFFTIESLICLNMQRPEVFAHFHRLIAALLGEGTFQGLRVDHIDGLYDARGYLEQLRKLAGPDTYIIVEKILGNGEPLPSWPVQGTTGYDFLTLVNHLFTRGESGETLSRFYEEINPAGGSGYLGEEKKAFILAQQLSGDLDNLTALFFHLDLASPRELEGVAVSQLREVIGALLVRCPVYKFYGDPFPVEGKESSMLREIFAGIKSEAGLRQAAVLLEAALLDKPAGDADYRGRALDFYRRAMQFTGVLMAKGVEDTLMYTHHRFVAHNEVGDACETFGLAASSFHSQMVRRAQELPLSLNATSTHDTKRGEDARARLAVLSDLDGAWVDAVRRWRRMNAELKNQGMPDANDEYFIYQTLMGAYPVPGEKEDRFDERLTGYVKKALREAKVHSSWAEPSADYEEAAKQFASSLLDKKRDFWKDFEALQRQVADFGIVNSLAQVLLKFMCPGIPDVFQGSEHWNFCFVDPDNRRPVDFKRLAAMLDEVEEADAKKVRSLWAGRFDGRIKVWLTGLLFHERVAHKEYFAGADYIPLQVEGRHEKHLLAFARRSAGAWYIVVLPLHLGRLCLSQHREIIGLDWGDTRVLLPHDAPGSYQDLLLKGEDSRGAALDAGLLFRELPLALLRLE
jgi:malto-oligosyltrehalose synthase